MMTGRIESLVCTKYIFDIEFYIIYFSNSILIYFKLYITIYIYIFFLKHRNYNYLRFYVTIPLIWSELFQNCEMCPHCQKKR